MKFDLKSLGAGVLFGIILVLIVFAAVNGGENKNKVQYLASYYFSEGIPGFAGGSGTWVIKGEELVNKYNAAEISCFNNYGEMSLEEIRSFGVEPEMYCYIAQADVFNGLLAADLSLFTITEWSPKRVVAESVGMCRKVTMTLDRESKTITQLATLLADSSDSELCGSFSSDPIQSFLTDGEKVIYPGN